MLMEGIFINKTEISFYNSKERSTGRYVSGTTVYEECLHNGRFVGLYWSASGQIQRENIVDRLPGSASYLGISFDPALYPVDSFKLEIDGQSLHNQWDWIESIKRPGERAGTEEAVIRIKHRIRPVCMNVVTCLDGSLILSRYLEITNTGVMPAALSHISVFSGLLWSIIPGEGHGLQIPFDKTRKAEYSLGYLKSVGWGQEGNFAWQPLQTEAFRIERNSNDKFSSPYYIIKNEVTGEFFFIALAWSGNYFAEFLHSSSDNCLSLKIGPSGPSPLRVIAPGETITSPKVHIGPMHCNIDRAVKNWHFHLRSSVIPERPSDKKMYTVAGRVIEEPGDWILREVDIAAEMGVEAFMVDAGWYGDEFKVWMENRGDWNEGTFLPEGGLSKICEYVHKKGMLFGLWMEPESLASTSKHWADHPEWRLTSDLSNREVYNNLIDLSNPEAAKYVEDSILGVMNNFQLDFFKTDYNQRLAEGGLNLRNGYAECEEWRHYETIYKIYDRVRKELPNISLENCSGGGGRNDLGMLSRFHYCCESDYSMMPYSIRAINTMSLFIPPESLCYYHNHLGDAHQTTDIDTHLRVTLFAVPIYVGFGAQNATREGVYFDKTKKYINLAKGFCHNIMANHPVVYHHTPYIGLLEPSEWCVLEYASPDKTCGYAGVFRIGAYTNEDEYIFKPRGIDITCNYNVATDNEGSTFTMSGKELATTGLSIHLENTNTSELLCYSKLGE